MRLIVNPALPVENVKDLIALAKQKPGEINYGTFGVGSSGHLNMELFQALSGAKFQAVHYKGATPALTDVMAGHIQMMFISVGSAVPQWKSDKVKLIAVGAGKRMALLPQVPTVAESGLPGYEAVSWFGLFGPPGMPADIVTKINAEVRKVFADPEIKKSFLERQYFEIDRRHARAAHRLHQGRRAEVAQGDPGRQGQGRVVGCTWRRPDKVGARRRRALPRMTLLRRPCGSRDRSRSLQTGTSRATSSTQAGNRGAEPGIRCAPLPLGGHAPRHPSQDLVALEDMVTKRADHVNDHHRGQ